MTIPMSPPAVIAPARSADARASLVETLRRDLIGPMPEDADLACELLPLPPSSWYLTGYLVSVFAPSKVKARDAEEEMDDGADGAGADDVAPPERTARRSILPSSCGLSLLLEPGTKTIEAEVSWGEYRREVHEQGLEDEEAPAMADLEEEAAEPKKLARQRHAWRRKPRQEGLRIELPEAGEPVMRMPVPNADGLEVSVLARSTKVPTESGLRDALAVSVFVVNRRFSLGDDSGEESIAFQVRLELRSPAILPRYDCRGYASDDWDERLADLHYRDVAEHAVGHNVSVECVGEEPGGGCPGVRTSWLPKAMVERTEPRQIAPEAMFRMATLGALPDAGAARALLMPLIGQYRQWIEGRKPALSGLADLRREVAEELLHRAGVAANRMEDGIEALRDPNALGAFRAANRAMAESARRRLARERGVRPGEINPAWRPFQLAFILLNLRGLVDPTHIDRETVDLLFFPTGGGKTEAYLGLAAFTLVYRRLRHSGDGGRGLSVLMRYTLRLLTLDQLGRAAAMICALELEREKEPERFGNWPFEIALWVGRAATPNRMGRSDVNDPNSARRRVIAYKNNSSRNPAPLPIEECPWCGTGFRPESFRLVPDDKAPTNLEVRCAERSCAFTRERKLPIVAVDEPIYGRLPAFMIATADKFAALPWTGETGRFFGRLSSDRDLPPPDLIIQDELHLISGPLGTMAGLYERAIDCLARREDGDGRIIRPKIIASTATVRLAQRQIKALFDRDRTEIFPPPGPDRRDSFFARQVPPDEAEPRLYLGLAAQGRGPKVLFLRAATSLMAAAERGRPAGSRPTTLPTPSRQPCRPLYDDRRLLQRAPRAGQRAQDRRGRDPYSPAELRRHPSAPRSARPAICRPPDRVRAARADLARRHRQGGGGQAPARRPLCRAETAGRRGAGHQHDLGRPRHHAAWLDAGPGPAQDHSRVYSGDQSRRPPGYQARPRRDPPQRPQAP